VALWDEEPLRLNPLIDEVGDGLEVERTIGRVLHLQRVTEALTSEGWALLDVVNLGPLDLWELLRVSLPSLVEPRVVWSLEPVHRVERVRVGVSSLC